MCAHSCVHVCVCTAGGCTQGQRPWERPVQARSRRARLPPRQLERISASGKSRTRLRNRISLLAFFFFFLFCLVSRRSLVLPTLSCGTSAPSAPLSSSCNISRLSHFTPMSLSPPLLLLSLISSRIYFPRRHRRCSVICDSPAMTDCATRLRLLSPDSAAGDR